MSSLPISNFTTSPVNTLAFAHLFSVARQMGCDVVDLHTCPRHVELTALGQYRQTAMSVTISEFFNYTHDTEIQIGLPCASMQRLFKNIEYDDTIRLSASHENSKSIDVTLVTKNHSLHYTVATVEAISSQLLTKEPAHGFSMSAQVLASTCKNLAAFGPIVKITLQDKGVLFQVEGYAESARMYFGEKPSSKEKYIEATFSLANLNKICSGKFGQKVEVTMWSGDDDGTALLGLVYNLGVIADTGNVAKFYVASQCL